MTIRTSRLAVLAVLIACGSPSSSSERTTPVVTPPPVDAAIAAKSPAPRDAAIAPEGAPEEPPATIPRIDMEGAPEEPPARSARIDMEGAPEEPPARSARIDGELAAAAPSVFRFYSTGLIATAAGPRLETWTLRRVGTRGMVLVERMVASGDGWKAGTTTLYTGTVADGATLAFTLASGPNQLSLACTRDKLAVVAATAVRKPHPRTGKYAQPCSGDPGRWVPPKQTQVDVLSCKHPDFEAPMHFAPAPGVEYLYVNDDCDQQGGGYRAIARDGAIAPVRSR